MPEGQKRRKERGKSIFPRVLQAPALPDGGGRGKNRYFRRGREGEAAPVSVSDGLCRKLFLRHAF